MGGSTQPGQNPSPWEVAQAQVANQQWQDYQKRHLPVVQYFIQRNKDSLAGQRALARGSVNTDIQTKYGAAGDQLRAQNAAKQTEIGSGKDIFSQVGLSNDLAGADSMGLTAADTGTQRKYEEGLLDIVGQARGQKTTSDQALSTLAGLGSQQAAQSAQLAEEREAGLGEAVGTAVGPGGGYGLSSLLNSDSSKTG